MAKRAVFIITFRSGA